MPDIVTAYLKLSNYCPLDCSHCYLPKDVREDQSRQSLESVKETAIYIEKVARLRGASRIHVIYHGGEPLALEAEYLYAVSDILQETFTLEYSESIQTALLPLKDNHIPFIQERLGGFVGSSIDFSQRTIGDSVERYHERWLKKVDLCRGYGIEVIPGVVPTRFQSDKGGNLLKWMRSNGFKAFNIDRYNNYSSAPDLDYPSNNQHSNFLISLFDAVFEELRTGKSPLAINVITTSLRGVMLGMPGDRWGTTCQSDFIVINPDGTTNACPDRIEHEESYGNVKDGAERFIASPIRIKWIKEQTIGHKGNHCSTCEFSGWCKSGCPITPNTKANNDTCSGYKPFLLHVSEFLEIEGNGILAREYLEAV